MTNIIDDNYNFKTTKFSKLSKPNQHHGKIAAWLKKNPDFTANELMNSGVCSADNADEYYEEFIAYRKFFSTLYDIKQ